jgi:hypothetical protein
VADLLLDADIGEADAAMLRDQVAADIDAVEDDFGMRFDARPQIHVLSTTARYAAALHALFGYPDATARWVADNSVSFFEPSNREIAVNWEAIRERRPIAAIRHELTHLLTVHACAPRCDLVPAWLNEGEARYAEAMTAGSEWRVLRMRYEAASLAATRSLLPLTSLVRQESWNAITGWDGYYKYQEAARVMELLRADVGASPIERLYERIRQGEDVASAYASLSGNTFASFVATLPDRLLADAQAPGIATARGTPDGAGVSYVLYGFDPGSELALTIASAHSASTQRVQVSPRGTTFAWLGDDLPRGTYTLTAASAAICVSVTVAKGGRRPILDPDAGAPVRGCAREPFASRAF